MIDLRVVVSRRSGVRKFGFCHYVGLVIVIADYLVNSVPYTDKSR